MNNRKEVNNMPCVEKYYAGSCRDEKYQSWQAKGTLCWTEYDTGIAASAGAVICPNQFRFVLEGNRYPIAEPEWFEIQTIVTYNILNEGEVDNVWFNHKPTGRKYRIRVDSLTYGGSIYSYEFYH